MGECLLCVTLFVGEDEGRGEGGNAEPKVEECITVRREGGWIRRAGSLQVWAVWRCGIGPVVIRFGVKVVRGAWAASARKRREWDDGLGEITICGAEYAVMIDSRNIWVVGGSGWRRYSLGQQPRREEQCRDE